MQWFIEFPDEEPASPEDVAALPKKINRTQSVIVGHEIPAVVLWLMVLKPY